MKTILISIGILFSFFLTAFSQSDNENERKNKWNFSIGINSVPAQIGSPEEKRFDSQLIGGSIGNNFDKKDNSISISLIPGYYIRKDILLRMEFGLTNFHFKYEGFYKKGTTHTTGQAEQKQSVYRFIPCIQYDFLKIKKLIFFGGLNLSFSKYSSAEFYSIDEFRRLPIDTLIQLDKTTYSIPGGNVIGIGYLLGFIIMIQTNISIGGEFNTALLYYNLGGEISAQTTIQNIPNPPVSSEATFTNSYCGFQFSKILPSLKISFRF